MTGPYRCIIVDDDEIDRLTTVSFVKKYSEFEISGAYASATEALEAVEKAFPQIAFFDIDMPGMSGLELRKKLQSIPACIFITSYAEYAVESFELAALDFLVKPINAARFSKTVDRIIEYLRITEKAKQLDHTIGADTVFIKDGHNQVKLQMNDVIYLEALKDYTTIVTRTKKYCVLGTLGNFLREAAFSEFIRVHRSFAVQRHFIRRISNAEIEVDEITLPVGRTYKASLDDLLK